MALPFTMDGAFDGSFAGTARDTRGIQAFPWYYRREYYTGGWTDAVLFRSAILAYVGIFNAVLLSCFIYATATASGGHLNPTITFTTMPCGLTPLSRDIREGGNFFDPQFKTPGQALLTEIMSTIALLLLAIGTGLDPRQQVMYGRQLGPLLVGLSMGLVTCASTGVAQGYTGPGMNPARAIALAIAGSNWQRAFPLFLEGQGLASCSLAEMVQVVLELSTIAKFRDRDFEKANDPPVGTVFPGCHRMFQNSGASSASGTAGSKALSIFAGPESGWLLQPQQRRRLGTSA
ncbi:aquaporin-like protein [Bombardia bombarda]|uniref:Aquaporin-like protein n=1 Tax=Bombardia bombarda TaxID=252184 RepID=A0AA40CEX2_9PEZI|nr:aquaporin-like protein [Bombardia bombarda]